MKLIPSVAKDEGISDNLTKYSSYYSPWKCLQFTGMIRNVQTKNIDTIAKC